MAREMKKDGIELTHLIGPKTEHKYHPDSIPEINKRIDSIVSKGRNPIPMHVKFSTYTLRYNKMFWVTVDGLEQHWEKATVDAKIIGRNKLIISTENVTAFSIEIPAGHLTNDGLSFEVLIDGEKAEAPPIFSDRSFVAHYFNVQGVWLTSPKIGILGLGITTFPKGTESVVEKSKVKNQRDTIRFFEATNLNKKHGLQGPIDDAFLEPFIFVRPTGKASNEAIGAWVDSELNRAIQQWRAQFRGEAIVKNDDEITAEDIANSNLILWGEASSNKILAKIADKLPIKWNANNIQIGAKNYASSQHIPILIYPNPLNPNRYIALNSGFTFREADILSNAKQTAKLPDWAIIDITTPPNVYKVGKVVNAGFFGERWELK